jgi:2-succinyl-5-enolpyruvyl-6-hydroxy-3-cyclohexene-1-carboxylate synthase
MSAALLTEWARLLIDTLVQCGVADAVISPGSRSTPFAWAALGHSGLRCHSSLDERCAGFFALGQAKLSGRPTLLIATSGSAPGHYLPAMLEAGYSHTPLIALSADRPVELWHRSAPQTIEQSGLFASAVRGSFDLGVPDGSFDALVGLQATIAQAVSRSLSPTPGAVHLNAQARKPLGPGQPQTESEQRVATDVARLIARGPTRFAAAPPAVDPEGLAALVQDLSESPRGLLVCGAVPAWSRAAADEVLNLARTLELPLLAEVPSQLILGRHSEPACAGFDSFLGAPSFADMEPDCVLELGPPLTSQAFATLSARWPNARRHVVAPHAWPDVGGSARFLHRAEVAALVRELRRRSAPRTEGARERNRWLTRFTRARDIAAEARRQVLDTLPFGEAHAVHQICGALPRSSLLLIGNSLPIRSVDAFAAPGSRDIVSIVQRGTNGIDGLVSGAAGLASRAAAATTLLVGDVSLAHDVGGLMLARRASAPLALVVLDNAGGRIFDELPWGDAAHATESTRAFWLTPPELDLEALARAYGVGYRRAEDPASLGAALDYAHQRPAATIVHVQVEPSSYHRARELLGQLTGERLAAAGDAA